MVTPVTVQCPLCKEEVDIPEYGAITRTDALAGHIVTRHSSQALPMPPTEGPPLPKVLNVHWPWKQQGR